MKNEIKKVAVVTGASRGIGYCVAKGLAADGYNVVIIARSEDKLKTLADEIVSHGVDVKIIATDITQHATLTKALAEVINQWGRVDVLVNNAGIFQHGTLDATLDDYQHMLDVNFNKCRGILHP